MSAPDPRPTLGQLLGDAGIVLPVDPRWGHPYGGPGSGLRCPVCGGGRRREENFYVQIDTDGRGFLAHCFRLQTCAVMGARRLPGAPSRTTGEG